MNVTYQSLIWLPTRSSPKRTSTSSSQPTSTSPLGPTTPSIPTATAGSRSTTRSAGSTVWGPGALTGKLLKWVGENVERGAENMIISNKLSKFEKLQPVLLRSAAGITYDDKLEIQYQCRKLVELCLIGLSYPSGLMTRAFTIVLRGFMLPGRQTWSHYIAEAIAERDIMEAYEIFSEAFFSLLDDSIFRLNAFIDLETLCYRCPVVASEIAAIISHLAQKDRSLRRVQTGTSLARVPSNTTAVESAPHPTFSHAIIKAGFFRLVKRWSERGLPHWDQRGIERLEDTLKYVAEAQEYHGDKETAAEARDLMRKLQARRLLVDDMEDITAKNGKFGIDEIP